MLTQHNISVRQSELYVLRVHLPQDAGWRSLTGVTALCQIRTSPQAASPTAAFGVTIQAENDLAILILTASENNKLTPGVQYEWDLRLSWVDGDVVYPIGGSIKTATAVSRP